MKKRTLALLVALVLVVGCIIGGTLAWLTAKTDAVVNTFTTSDIDVTLTETEEEYKMVPGYTIHNPAQINTNQVITNERNNNPNNYQSINLDGMDRMAERASYEELIRENLELDLLERNNRIDADRVHELVEIMLDAICSTSPTIRINGEDMPQVVVKSRFLKLDSSHIEYVLHAMDENPSDIRNIRAYLLTALYNASLTMDNYYSALVNRDLYGQPKATKSKSYDDNYRYQPGETL